MSKRQCPVLLEVYSDGACAKPRRKGDLGKGGWGVHAVFKDGRVHEVGGYDPQTTNNRMELIAAIEAAKLVQAVRTPGCTVAVYSDSQYVIRGITSWYLGWQERDWVNSQGEPVKNQDLWEALIEVRNGIRWQWCRGHSGTAGNERADEIASGFGFHQRPEIETLNLSVLDLSEFSAIDLAKFSREVIA